MGLHTTLDYPESDGPEKEVVLSKIITSNEIYAMICQGKTLTIPLTSMDYDIDASSVTISVQDTSSIEPDHMSRLFREGASSIFIDETTVTFNRKQIDSASRLRIVLGTSVCQSCNLFRVFSTDSHASDEEVTIEVQLSASWKYNNVYKMIDK